MADILELIGNLSIDSETDGLTNTDSGDATPTQDESAPITDCTPFRDGFGPNGSADRSRMAELLSPADALEASHFSLVMSPDVPTNVAQAHPVSDVSPSGRATMPREVCSRAAAAKKAETEDSACFWTEDSEDELAETAGELADMRLAEIMAAAPENLVEVHIEIASYVNGAGCVEGGVIDRFTTVGKDEKTQSDLPQGQDRSEAANHAHRTASKCMQICADKFDAPKSLILNDLQVCECGTEFAQDAIFCRMCGKRRHEASNCIKVCKCGNGFADDASFCRMCGRQREEVVKPGEFCKCGNQLAEDAIFCRMCGHQRKKDHCADTQCRSIFGAAAAESEASFSLKDAHLLVEDVLSMYRGCDSASNVSELLSPHGGSILPQPVLEDELHKAEIEKGTGNVGVQVPRESADGTETVDLDVQASSHVPKGQQLSMEIHDDSKASAEAVLQSKAPSDALAAPTFGLWSEASNLNVSKNGTGLSLSSGAAASEAKQQQASSDSNEQRHPGDGEEKPHPHDSEEPVRPDDSEEQLRPRDSEAQMQPVEGEEQMRACDLDERMRLTDSKGGVNPVLLLVPSPPKDESGSPTSSVADLDFNLVEMPSDCVTQPHEGATKQLIHYLQHPLPVRGRPHLRGNMRAGVAKVQCAPLQRRLLFGPRAAASSCEAELAGKSAPLIASSGTPDAPGLWIRHDAPLQAGSTSFPDPMTPQGHLHADQRQGSDSTTLRTQETFGVAVASGVLAQNASVFEPGDPHACPKLVPRQDMTPDMLQLLEGINDRVAQEQVAGLLQPSNHLTPEALQLQFGTALLQAANHLTPESLQRQERALASASFPQRTQSIDSRCVSDAEEHVCSPMETLPLRVTDSSPGRHVPSFSCGSEASSSFLRHTSPGGRALRLASGPLPKPSAPSGHAPSTGETLCEQDVSSCSSSWVDTSGSHAGFGGEDAGAPSKSGVAWANSIAGTRHQVGHMRAQLRSLSYCCDTLEVLAAPLRPPAEANGGRGVAKSHDALAQAHALVIQAASGQLAALRHGGPSNGASGKDVEAATLARIREWVADVSTESRGKTPACAAIAGMLEAAVEALADSEPPKPCTMAAPHSSRRVPGAPVPLRPLPSLPFQAPSYRPQWVEDAEMWSTLEAVLGDRRF